MSKICCGTDDDAEKNDFRLSIRYDHEGEEEGRKILWHQQQQLVPHAEEWTFECVSFAPQEPFYAQEETGEKSEA